MTTRPENTAEQEESDMQTVVTLDMIREARDALSGVAEKTPIVTSTRLGKNLYILKRWYAVLFMNLKNG